MFKRLRRYLVFLCVFALATNNIVDLDSLLEEGMPESAAVETLTDSSDEPCPAEENDLQLESASELQPELYQEQHNDTYGEKTEEFEDNSLEGVSCYLHTYQKLPPVYITKKEVLKQGLYGNSQAIDQDKMSIGGDYFGNYQGLLPVKEGRSYRECDIDSLGIRNRGTKRLVYSNDGLVYYTEDHYNTFTLLYSNWENENLQIL